MEKQAYKNKRGDERFRPVVSQAEFSEIASDGTTGFCIGCGNDTTGVEPDARRYDCETCNRPLVYGIEELLLMGLVSLKD